MNRRSPLLVLLLVALLGTGGAPAVGGDEAAEEVRVDDGWPQEAIRWLLSSTELRRWRRAVTPGEQVALLEEFWQRRDPDPGVVGNENRTLFLGRAELANLLYEGEGQPGCLTARGRAHTLLGPPSSLGQHYQKGPEWSPDRWRSRAVAATEHHLIETWNYRPEDLAPALREELAKDRWRTQLRLRFLVDNGRYQLLEGEALLKLAARSFLADRNP